MGDLNAVDVAQLTHEGILRDFAGFDLDTALRFGRPLPRSPLAYGIYVDDLVVALRLPLARIDDVHDDDADVELAGRASNAYTTVDGAGEATNKSVNQKSRFTAWGCLLYTSPSPRDQRGSRMPSSA